METHLMNMIFTISAALLPPHGLTHGMRNAGGGRQPQLHRHRQLSFAKGAQPSEQNAQL
ncbi:MAG: hypothetical protein LIO63_05990 [Akkermansia sp.]|nr:hypothetical protein [Akkermansia sp.]